MTHTLSLSTLRGLACLLLVAYHVVGDDASRGLHLAEGWLRQGSDALAFLRMPLFTFLSGIVYGLRPLRGDLTTFMLGKARRLLLPMLVVGTVYALVQSQVVGANAARFEWHRLHIEPVDHFWFVEALFWIFLLVGALESAGRHAAGGATRLLDRPVALAALWGAAVALQFGADLPRTLGLEGASYLLPYFVAGLATVRLDGLDKLCSARMRALLVVVTLLAVLQLGPIVPNPDRHTLPMLAAGTAGCLLCLSLRPQVSLLARIGSGSYAIYLMHVFFTAGSRLTLQSLGIDGVATQFVIGVAMGLAGPLLVQQLARRQPWAAWLLLGESRGESRPDPALQGARP